MIKEIRVLYAESEDMRVFHEKTDQPKGSPKIEIVTNGIQSLVYINGQRINRVLDVQLPVRRDEIGPQVVLKIHADEIVQRTVSGEEYKRLADA